MNTTNKLNRYLDEMETIGRDEEEMHDDLFDLMADFILELDEETLTDEQQDIYGEILDDLGYDEDDIDDAFDTDDVDEDELDDDLDNIDELRMAHRTSAKDRMKSKAYLRKNKQKVKRKRKKFKKSAAGKRREVKKKKMAGRNKTATGRKKVKYH